MGVLRPSRVGLLLLLSIISAVGFGQSIVQVITLPSTTYWNATYGVAGDSTALYVSSNTSTTTLFNYGKVYKLNPAGQVIDSVTSTGVTFGQSQGLAFDGTNLYYVRRYTASCTVIKSDLSGNIIDSMRFGSSRYLGDAVWANGYLWVSMYSPNPGRLLKVDWNTKSLVDSIWTIGDQPTGVAWDGQYLYYAMDIFSTEPNTNLIYVLNPATGDTVRTIQMPEAPTTDSNPRGLVCDGRYLWLVARPVGGGTGQRIYKYDLGGAGTPAINIPTKYYDLGRVRIGNNRQANPVIQSSGSAALRIDSVRVLYSNRFTTDLVAPQTIQPGASVPFTITFTPTLFGIDSAQVVIYHNDPARPPQVVRVVGMGIYPSAYIGVPASYNFGSRRVGSTSSYTLRIENQGATPLIVDAGSFNSSNFYIVQGTFPLTVDSVNFRNVKVWFNPLAATSYLDTLKLTSNASNGAVVSVVFQGSGDATPVPIGTPFWNYTVPDHPISNTGRLVKAVRSIGDITGDGKPDIIISTENYWTMAVSGNASVTTDSVWAFTSYIANTSAGSIGTTGDYSHQKALAIASDLNGDGFNDVVIGTGGGNEHVYALSGRTGQMLWTFGTDNPDSFGLGDFTGVDVSTDFNNDGVPDVIAAAAATQSGGVGGRRTVYLFNGANGNILWLSPLLGFTHGVTAIADISGDGVPDVIGAVGEPSYKASAFSGANGTLLWDFAVSSSTGGGKELMALPIPGQSPDIIVGAFWGPVHRVDAETGIQVWATSTGGSGVMQLSRLRDVTGDGIDEILVALLGGGAMCINGATGAVIWSLPTGNTMGIASIPDLNNDGFNDAVIAVQSQGALIVKGQDGTQLGMYSFGGNQTREVAIVPDLDGNNSWEIIAGGNVGNVALISGGLNAGPTSVGDGTELPEKFSLSQNYPNPFNPTTTIELSVPVQSDLTLTIYDVLGKKVRSYEYEKVPAGVHRIEWDGTNGKGTNVASGMYFYQLRAGNQVLTRRMMLLK